MGDNGRSRKPTGDHRRQREATEVSYRAQIPRTDFGQRDGTYVSNITTRKLKLRYLGN